jgi:hypothetical protein
MDLKDIIISAESPFSTDATTLMNELSECLQDITGDSGKCSFNTNDVCNDKDLFIIAKNQNGKAIS